MIHVIAIFTAKPGLRGQILDELLPRVPEVQAEPGCIEYSVAVDSEAAGGMPLPNALGPDAFMCIEKWESLARFETHSTTPFVNAYLEIVGPKLLDVKVHFLSTAS